MNENNPYLELRENFDSFWVSSLQPFLKTKEDMRKKYVSRFWFLILLSVFVLPVLAIGIYTLNKHFSKDIAGKLF